MIDCHLETSIHLHVQVIPNFVSLYTLYICYATKDFLHSESFAANVYADCSRSFSKYIYQGNVIEQYRAAIISQKCI
jgi:hypothetical protein